MNDIEKAIEDLKDINTILKTQHMCKVLDDELTKKDVEDYKSRFASVNLAISALEKQMPKKIKKFTYPKNIVYMYCPECDEGIDENNLFCSRCGQKINWEVENE
jgi:rRNA maturation endonuclease Nob1